MRNGGRQRARVWMSCQQKGRHYRPVIRNRRGTGALAVSLLARYARELRMNSEKNTSKWAGSTQKLVKTRHSHAKEPRENTLRQGIPEFHNTMPGPGRLSVGRLAPCCDCSIAYCTHHDNIGIFHKHTGYTLVKRHTVPSAIFVI